MDQSRPQIPLREALEHDFEHLTESLVHRTFSDHSPCPRPIPAGVPLPRLAKTYATFLSHNPAHVIRQLVAHELHLFPSRSENPPTLLLNRLLIQAHFLEDLSADENREKLDELNDAVDNDNFLVENGKRECKEYRRSWEWLEELTTYMFIASHGGLAFGVKHDELEEWFWGLFERVTGMRRFSGLVSLGSEYGAIADE